MDRLTLPLELGKRYERRNGRTVTARVLWTGGVMRFDEGSDARVETGLVPRDDASKLHPHDLVADYVEQVKAHPHAASMLLYAQDAAETDKPWERWQFRRKGCGWESPQVDSLSWNPFTEYRRTPKTIRIGEIEVPAPLRVAPAKGDAYYVPVLGPVGSEIYTWDGDDVDRHYLAMGLAHLDRRAADTHGRALIAPTAVS